METPSSSFLFPCHLSPRFLEAFAIGRCLQAGPVLLICVLASPAFTKINI